MGKMSFIYYWLFFFSTICFSATTKISLTEKKLIIEAQGRAPESYPRKSCHQKIINRYIQKKEQSRACLKNDVDGELIFEITLQKKSQARSIPLCSQKELPLSALLLSLQKCR